jgi:hypothetical protein
LNASFGPELFILLVNMIRLPLSRILPAIVCLLWLSGASAAAELEQKTVVAFNRYVAATEARFANELRPGGPFLYVDALAGDTQKTAYDQLKRGDILVERLQTKISGKDTDVPDGIIHHWVGLAFIPSTALAKVIPAVQDYGHRDELYKPDVIAARVVSHQGNDYKIFMRLYQKRFTTVVFNTDYDIHWGQVDAKKVYSNSYSTRIAQVKDASHPDGEEMPVGKDSGYLWRLYTYWRFQEKDGGVYVQCEAVSLTRDIPTGLGWLLRPLVTKIPKESLNKVLGRTRDVVQQQIKNSSQPSALSIQPAKQFGLLSVPSWPL